MPLDPIEPGGSDNEVVLGHLTDSPFACQFGFPVNGQELGSDHGEGLSIKDLCQK